MPDNAQLFKIVTSIPRLVLRKGKFASIEKISKFVSVKIILGLPPGIRKAISKGAEKSLRPALVRFL